MANVQVEDGHLRIADALTVALTKALLTAVQYKVVLAIMSMTYRVNKSKAAISMDDLRYATDQKSYKIKDALDDLIQRKIIYTQALVNGDVILGIQKDIDLWLPKMGSSNTSVLQGISINTPYVVLVPKMGSVTPPEKFLKYVLEDLNLEVSMAVWKAERKFAVQLYTRALELAHEPLEAFTALLDYYQSVCDAAFRARVNRPMRWMAQGFGKWYKTIPEKPYRVKQDEKAMGRRYRYNHKTKSWGPV